MVTQKKNQNEKDCDKINKAQYLMSRANTLLLTGSIFILAFVTLFASSNEKTELTYVLAGLGLFGMSCIFVGLGNFFEAEKTIYGNLPFDNIITTLWSKQIITFILIIIFAIILPYIFICGIFNIELGSIQGFTIIFGTLFAAIMVGIAQIPKYINK